MHDAQQNAAMPAIGTHVRVRREPGGDEDFLAAIVVGHLTDPALGNILMLRLSDSRRLRHAWPSPTIRVLPVA